MLQLFENFANKITQNETRTSCFVTIFASKFHKGRIELGLDIGYFFDSRIDSSFPALLTVHSAELCQ